MKKILLSLALFASIGSMAQSVTLYTDTLTQSKYCNLEPIQWSRLDVDSVRTMYISYNDNGISCVIYFSLKGLSGVIYQSNMTITGDDYKAWSNDSYLYNYVANKLRLNIAD